MGDDKRLIVCNTQQCEDFLPCPFCGSGDQSVREWRSSWSNSVIFTVVVCCNRCGMEIPVDVEFDKLPSGKLVDILRSRIDDVRTRWNTRWSRDDG